MPDNKKKAYDAPDIEKITLADDALNKVSGGTQPDGATDGDDLPSDPDSELVGGIDDIPPEQQGWGNPDVGRGWGRGGGCDGTSYHKSARTFSSGRNSKC